MQSPASQNIPTFRAGLTLFLDPTPPERVETEVLATADVITPDRAEAAALTGRADTSQLWAGLAAEELRRAGARIVVVKTGASGAVLADGHGTVRIPTLRVDARDETGAGDVFLADDDARVVGVRLEFVGGPRPPPRCFAVLDLSLHCQFVHPHCKG